MHLYPWQASQYQSLQAARASHRLAHAFLLVGEKGLGKYQFAKQFAASLLCEASHDKQAMTCLQCRACQWFLHETHPDYEEISAENALITIEKIREMIAWLTQKSHMQGGVKVVLLTLAEEMNLAAANALLKQLEEPCEKTYFILISLNSGLVLPTIKSRCQLIKFMSNESISRTWLQSFGYEINHIEQALCLFPESPLLAKVLLEEPKNITKYQQWMQDLAYLISQKHYNSEMSNRWRQEEGSHLLDVLSICIAALFKMTLQTTHGVSCQFTTGDANQFLLSHVNAYPKIWIRFYDNVLEMRKLLFEGYHLNKDLMVDALFALFIRGVEC